MSDRREYFERAESWSSDVRAQSARLQRIAWIAAAVAAGIACFEAVALAMLTPLKTVQPITLLVDRQTGFVQAVDPALPGRMAANEALTRAFLAQYVTAREGFDRATISADYRKVALWSAGLARSSYVSGLPATNPDSPFNRYSPGTVVAARIKSISRLGDGLALVRFDTLVQDSNGSQATAQPWISTVRYRYVDAPMSLDDRLVNPLGFQVISYRRDAEAEPEPISNEPGAAVTSVQENPSPQSVRASAAQISQSSGFAVLPDGRQIPLTNLPSGSPLASSAARRGD